MVSATRLICGLTKWTEHVREMFLPMNRPTPTPPGRGALSLALLRGASNGFGFHALMAHGRGALSVPLLGGVGVGSESPCAREARGFLAALRRIFWVGLSLLVIVPASAAPSLTAKLDRDTMTVGESVVLSLTFEGGAPSRPPPVPVQPNLTIQYAGQSSQFTIVNGQTTSALTHNYRVMASHPGDYVIPAIQAVIDNRTHTTQPLRLKALKAGDNTAGSGPKHAFVKLIVPKNTVYVGEVLPVEIQLYVQNPHDLQMPQFKAEGFTLGTMPQPGRTQAQSGNVIYTVFVFKVTASPVKAGTLSLGPVECSLVLRYRKSRDSLDPLGDLFGGGIELRKVIVSSEAQSIEVLPLPKENRPESFNGAVGQFSLALNASPTNVTAGDPITLKLQITGSGTLDALPFPPQLDWREFKTYPPTSKVVTSDPIGLSGVKTFEQVVIPQNVEVKEVPGIAFSFFDPDLKTYRTLQHPPIPLSVRPSTVLQPQPTVIADTPQVQDKPPVRDIVHIKPYLGMAVQIHPPLVRQTWFLALQAIPLAAWLSAWIWRKRQEMLTKDPRLRRRLRVSALVRKGLHTLHALASANRAEEFFATVFRLLQEQLGERLDLPASSITEAVVDERLRTRDASDELIRRLHELFLVCNRARYAPERTPQELMSIVPQVELALRDLMKLQDETTR